MRSDTETSKLSFGLPCFGQAAKEIEKPWLDPCTISSLTQSHPLLPTTQARYSPRNTISSLCTQALPMSLTPQRPGSPCC